MSRIIADRVMETSTVTGTGSATVAGAVPGFQAFSTVCAAGDTFDYVIFGVDGVGTPTGEWESGRGTYPSANTIARTVVIDGSSGPGTPVSFSAGTKNVMATHVAKSVRAAAPRAPWTIPRIADFTTTHNISGAVAAFDDDEGITFTFDAGASFALHGYDKAAPGGTYSIYARFHHHYIAPAANSRYGVLLRNSANSHMATWAFYTSATGFSLKETRWDSSTSYSAEGSDYLKNTPTTPEWVKVDVDGTGTKIWVGNGLHWVDTGVYVSHATHLGATPTHIGIGGQMGDASVFTCNSFSTVAPVAGGGGI